MTIIFDGRKWAELEITELKNKILMLKENYQITPKLVTILVGDDPASKLYTKLKKNKAEEIGAKFVIRFFEDTDKATLIKLIEKYNQDTSVHGIMIQLPLPKSLTIYKEEIVDAIDPQKDVDGLRVDSPYLHPTSKAVVSIIEQSTTTDINDHVVVVGSRGMVGKPLVNELKKIGYKVLEANTDTKDLTGVVRQGDVVVSAVGKPNLITGDMIKKGAAIVDVGSPKGDFEFESVSKKASFITPVPGGVGPLTIAKLFENLVASVPIV